MARPLKDEADYFPLNVKFIQDNKIKLLKSEFGFQCVTVIIAIFSEIYGENGYYMKWDNDTCLLMSEGVGGGCRPEYVREVVQGCLRRSLFDERVFKMFGILTSRGIQKRYVRIFEKREEIRMIEEYFLLDITDKQDIPGSIKGKITFKSINGGRNEVSVPENKQSKVKESKVKENTPPKSPAGGHGKSDKSKKDELNKIFAESTAKFSAALKKCAVEWLKYKKQLEKKSEPYTEIGLSKWLKKLRENADLYGELAVIEVIDDTMSNDYKGVTWNVLRKQNGGIQNGSNGGNAGKNYIKSADGKTNIVEEETSYSDVV